MPETISSAGGTNEWEPAAESEKAAEQDLETVLKKENFMSGVADFLRRSPVGPVLFNALLAGSLGGARPAEAVVPEVVRARIEEQDVYRILKNILSGQEEVEETTLLFEALKGSKNPKLREYLQLADDRAVAAKFVESLSAALSSIKLKNADLDTEVKNQISNHEVISWAVTTGADLVKLLQEDGLKSVDEGDSTGWLDGTKVSVADAKKYLLMGRYDKDPITGRSLKELIALAKEMSPDDVASIQHLVSIVEEEGLVAALAAELNTPDNPSDAVDMYTIAPDDEPAP